MMHIFNYTIFLIGLLNDYNMSFKLGAFITRCFYTCMRSVRGWRKYVTRDSKGKFTAI